MRLHTLKAMVMLSSVVLVTLVMALSLTLVAAQGIANVENTNAFAEYRGLVPGQPLPDLDQMTCHAAPVVSGHDPNRSLCAMVPKAGPFTLITLATQGETISEVNFRSESLQLVSLLEQWQKPDQIRRGRSGQAVILFWDQVNYRVLAVAYLVHVKPHIPLVILREGTGRSRPAPMAPGSLSTNPFHPKNRPEHARARDSPVLAATKTPHASAYTESGASVR